MSEAGDSTTSHKRSRSSAALALLRASKEGRSAAAIDNEDVNSEDGYAGSASGGPTAALTSNPTTATSQAGLSMAHQQALRGHRPGLSTASIPRLPSYQGQAQTPGGGSSIKSGAGGGGGATGAAAMPPTSSPPPTGPVVLSLEQSIRKFRMVESLRNGDTASISKAIRETAAAEGAPRASTSSVNTAAAAAGWLEDTTILHLAVQCAEFPVVEYVLAEAKDPGAIDVNARDRDGNTALHIASMGGRTQVVRLLLEQKDINDSIANYQGRLPIDLARNPDIFQQLQLSRSVFTETKIGQIQELVARGDYKALEVVLEEPRLKTVLDINSPDFASEPATVQAGGSLLHEAARRRNTQLIQVLLLHGADPFRRDRRGKLPQDVTKDDVTRAMLKRSPAAVAAQRGIQEKAVLGQAASQGMASASPGDPLAGRESREMKGYLKKWTNYRKGYQLRWFVLEDGVLSYYKHQDDAGSACRGAINMRIAQLHMSPDEKTKFEIIGKSSVKYTLKANHEVEAKRWFWALNNSIQWSKDQAKEEERQQARSQELLRQAKEHSVGDPHSENASIAEPQASRRGSSQLSRMHSNAKGAHGSGVAAAGGVTGPSTAGSFDDEGGPDASGFGDTSKHATSNPGTTLPGDGDDDDDDDFGEDSSGARGDGAPSQATKDAFNITAQSTKLQLDTIASVNSALLSEAARNPSLTLSDPRTAAALQTYDAAIRSLTGLVGDLLRISRDRDAYWQYRLDREGEMRRMWEESMAQVAREHEQLEQKVGTEQMKRRLTRRALKEVMAETGVSLDDGGRAESSAGSHVAPDEQPSPVLEKKSTVTPSQAGTTAAAAAAAAAATVSEKAAGKLPADLANAPSFLSNAPSYLTSSSMGQKSPTMSVARRSTVLEQVAQLSDSEDDDSEDEFFDAVDAGEVEVAPMPPGDGEWAEGKQIVVQGLDISDSFRGYEGGIRTKLKIDADNRPKMSLWGILKSMIGKDMTKMTLPVTFNEPTSLLYRTGEDMEYADLLDLAADRSDSIERLVYVAAFASSIFASTIDRVAKPFNPLLGETFEYVRPDKNYRFFIEQVSHHPPIGACWAESPKWTYYGEANVKSRFSGRAFDINHLGTWFLRIRPTSGGREDFYSWKKVTSTVVGIITGNPMVDNYGPMEITNHTTGEVAHLEFKARGWKAASAYQITGKVCDSDGRTRISLGGRWNSRLYARLTPGYVDAGVEENGAKSGGGGGGSSSGPGSALHRGSLSDPTKAFLIWQANARPQGIPFNLTPFVLTFNNLDEHLRAWIAPTDSRLRPDQRAMEEADYDAAADEKNRLEEAQRDRRRVREAQGTEFVPAWFVKDKCDVTGADYWRFTGRYWDQRRKAGRGDKHAWDGLEPIYEG